MNRAKYLITALLAIIFLAVFMEHVFIVPKINYFLKDMPQKVEEVLKTRHGIYLPLSKISVYVKYAAISSQDQRFYENSGVDLRGNLRAIFYSVTSGKRQGASTITEQLAKNLYFNDKDDLQTDIETKILALFITRLYPKDKILEMYLNEIYFGKLAYGISSASSVYFRTTPGKLSVAQSAYLMGLIDAPSYFQDNPKQAQKEAGLVLEQMQKLKFITSFQEQQAEKSVSSAHFSL